MREQITKPGIAGAAARAGWPRGEAESIRLPIGLAVRGKADQVRSLRPSRRADGSVYFAELNVQKARSAAKRVPRNDAGEIPDSMPVSEGEQPRETTWARAERRGRTYVVSQPASVSTSRVYPCATERAAWQVAAVTNGTLLIDQLRRHDEVVVLITAAAPNALDGDKVDHVENVGRELNRKIDRAGRRPHVLRVNEDQGVGYHAHFTMAAPIALLPNLFAIGQQVRVDRFDVKDANGKVVSTAFDLKIAAAGSLADRLEAMYPGRVDRNGVGGIAGYMAKAACGSVPLATGGSRVMPNGNLSREMAAWGLYEPRPRENPRRGLPRDPKLKPVVYRDDLFDGALSVHVSPVSAVSAPRRREKLQTPPQLPLDLAPDAIDMLAALAPTDQARAAIVGRSRAQVTNIRNRQFRASRDVVRTIIAASKTAGGQFQLAA